MHLSDIHTSLCWMLLACAAPTFVTLTAGITAPYGRYTRGGWGFLIPGKIAWCLQEAPSALVPLLCIRYGRPECLHSPANRVLLAAFLFHYVYRAFIFPWRMRQPKGTPISVFLMSFVFCVINGFLQGWYLSGIQPIQSTIHVMLGLSVWFCGWMINLHSDNILRGLRDKTIGDPSGDYKIPRGGAFELVSGANYLGEIIEWGGFAIACWSLASLTFFVFTFANLAPRGYQHHLFYKRKFKHAYPANRRAIIPWIW